MQDQRQPKDKVITKQPLVISPSTWFQAGFISIGILACACLFFTSHQLSQFTDKINDGNRASSALLDIENKRLTLITSNLSDAAPALQAIYRDAFSLVNDRFNKKYNQTLTLSLLELDKFKALVNGLPSDSAYRINVDTLNLLNTLALSPADKRIDYFSVPFSLSPLLFVIDDEKRTLAEQAGTLALRLQLFTLTVVMALIGAVLIAAFNRNAVPRLTKSTRNGQTRLLRRKSDKALLKQNQFLRLISHEFRAPISAIISALELIPNMENQRTRLLQQAEQSSYRLLNLTNNLTEILSSNTHEEMNFTRVDLISLLDESISPFSVRVKDKKLELNMHCSHSVPQYVETDPIAVSKVIVNILDNAVKFTSTGLIDINATTEVNDKRIFLKVVINDTGVGIDAPTQAKMFENFFRGDHVSGERFPGAGIGLSVVKNNIDNLDGTIHVNSTVGVGTEITVRIPIKPLSSPASIEVTPSNGKFAIVDDLEISRLHLQSIVTSEGYAARSFSSGASLLALHEDILQFNAIIADLYMPGMNGLELVKTLHAIYGERTPPVVVLSSTPDIANIIASSDLPIFQSFVKPIDRQRFIDTLHHINTNKMRILKEVSKSHVLVVEDEPINAEMVEYMLQCMGHDVTVSYTGDDAIGRSNETQFDCVLLDINLPDMSGLDVAKIMKEKHPDLPIIALTANAHRNDKVASLNAGVRYHLVKPVTFQELKNTLKLAL